MKTPEKIKKGLCNCVRDTVCKNCPYDYDCSMTGDSRVIARDSLEYIQQLENHIGELTEMVTQLKAVQPKWISANKQPHPPKDGQYYCYGYWIGSGKKQMGEAEYLCGEWKISNNFVLTHWMQTPEPPKE